MGQGNSQFWKKENRHDLASMARKYEPRKAPEGERQATSAMIASLAAEGYDTVAAPFGNALVDAARKDERTSA